MYLGYANCHEKICKIDSNIRLLKNGGGKSAVASCLTLYPALKSFPRLFEAIPNRLLDDNSTPPFEKEKRESPHSIGVGDLVALMIWRGEIRVREWLESIAWELICHNNARFILLVVDSLIIRLISTGQWKFLGKESVRCINDARD